MRIVKINIGMVPDFITDLYHLLFTNYSLIIYCRRRSQTVTNVILNSKKRIPLSLENIIEIIVQKKTRLYN